jgi:ABC-2 type transport system permease protein
MRSFLTLLHRELWEHTSLYRLPLALLLLVFLGNLAVMLWGSDVGIYVALENRAIRIGNVNEMLANGVKGGHVAGLSESMRLIMTSIGMMIHFVMLLLLAIYAQDSLFRERKDKSILFWKSLPVSDSKIVLSKLVTAVVVIPVIAFLTVMAAQIMTWFMQGMALGDMPDALGTLWGHARLPYYWSGFFFLGIQQVVWLFPLVAWLLLCSAWAKKSPATWAFVLPMLLMFIDSAFRLHTGFTRLLMDRLSLGMPSLDNIRGKDGMGGETADGVLGIVDSMTTSSLANLLQFLSRADTLAGIAVGGLFILLAILIRRRRGDESNLLISTGA